MVRLSFLARAGFALAAGVVAAASPGAAAARGGWVDWPQWGQNAEHQGSVATLAQNLQQTLAVVCANTGVAQGPFYVTQVSENLHVEWRFQNTNTDTCTLQPDGTLSCVNDTPQGFEWCVNAPAVDGNGTVYANSEDGFLYSIPQGHQGTFTQFQQRVFMGLALGNAYTPSSISRDGLVFTSDNGRLFAIGSHD
jgi:outer membrane protein assembly factor BamB